MVLEIDGVNIVPYIAFGGFQWQRSDLDGPGSGRDLSSDLHRNRLGTKRRLDVCAILRSPAGRSDHEDNVFQQQSSVLHDQAS